MNFSKVLLKNHFLPGNSAGDLFGIVSLRDPNLKVVIGDLQRWGSKGHFESPGGDFCW